MTYNYNFLKVENIGDFVVTVSLNRPKQLNALNLEIWGEIGDVFLRLEDDPDCRVIVLTAEGRAFTAGLDIKSVNLSEFGEGEDGARKSRSLRKKIIFMQQCFTNIEKCTRPVIAAVHGLCLGGGIDLISACDIRHCTKDAVFSVKEVDVGLAADVGSLNRLPKIVGNESWLKEVTFTARNFSAAEAEKYDLISKVYENRDDMLIGVKELARTIALKSPVAVQGSKVVLNYSRDHSVDESLNFVANWNASQLFTDDILGCGLAVLTKSPMPPFSKL